MIRRSFIARVLAAVCGACVPWKAAEPEKLAEPSVAVPGWSGGGKIHLPNGWVVQAEVVDGELRIK